MKKNILITGAAGYVGSHTLRVISAAGHNPVALDDLSTGNRWAVPDSVPFYEGDFSDSGLLRTIHQKHPFEDVIHLAAKTSVGESVERPELYWRENSEKVSVLLKACQELGLKNFVFSSTCAVYGTPKFEKVSEGDTAVPENPYGASKLEAEKSIQLMASRGGFHYAILRYFNVAGALADLSVGPANESVKSLIKICCETALGKRKEVEILGDDYPTPDGTGCRDYIHVEDISEAHLEVLKYLWGGGASEVFNCGYGRSHSVREVISAVESVSGNKINSRVGARRKGDIATIFANPEKLMKKTDWRPQYDNLIKICRSAFDWEKNGKAKLF